LTETNWGTVMIGLRALLLGLTMGLASIAVALAEAPQFHAGPDRTDRKSVV